ncbi:stemmadenine O-acetyltransferase-like [Tripterygium wilfordii]|uniref:stemmadenine O-acetyltransferase-like n=1 Tax=Tripterygium wilfordii TaxID=458696 RepID=UPI0018F81927|nr:stemmadenine O-acetyltransferase-like [Tripterygium wilfordii]
MVFLFIGGPINIYFYIPTKKFDDWLQHPFLVPKSSSFLSSASTSPVSITNTTSQGMGMGEVRTQDLAQRKSLTHFLSFADLFPFLFDRGHSSRYHTHECHLSYFLLDQFAPPIYASNLLFYSTQEAASISISQRSQVLKQSLSRTLTLYYPFAGRNIDNFSIDCNDEGISYTMAKVSCKLSDYLKQPDFSKFPKFMPEEIILCEMTPGCHLVKIQETMFACGGFAIGFGTAHNIIDATSMMPFLNTWGSMAREGVALSPDFNCSYIFPRNSTFPQDLTLLALTNRLYQEKGVFVGRRFVFEGPMMSNLKAKASRLGVQKPTRAEVVVALLFKCIMFASKAKFGAKKKSALLSTSVNFRRRAEPKFPQTSVGNIILLATITTNSDETDAGTYSIDFGWGKPLWFPAFGSALGISGSVIQLVDTRSGIGIEAWVSLDEEIMTMVEHDKELLSVASVDPIPLEIDLLKSRL